MRQGNIKLAYSYMDSIN